MTEPRLPMAASAVPIPIDAARSFAQRHGLPTVILFYELPDGRLGYTSYGQTKALCGRARRLADRAFDLLESIR